MADIKNKIKDTVTVRELKRILHDKDLMLILLIVPLFYLFFYGAVYKNKIINQLKVAIVDKDQTELALALRKNILADPVLQPVSVTSFEQARELLDQQKIQAIILVPDNFEKTIKKGLQVKVPLYISTINFMVNIEANKRLGAILQQLNYGIITKYWLSRSLHKEAALSKVLPVNLSIHPVGNPLYSYGDFVITGLVILILQQLLLIGIAESTALEKEENSLKSWYDAAKQSVIRMIAGKGIVHLSFYFVYFLVVLVIVLPVFKIKPHGKWMWLLIYAFFFFVTTFSIGLLVGSFFTRKIQAMQVLSVTSVPIFLMTGYTWPFFMLPSGIKGLSYLLPTYWMLMPFQNVIRIGAPVHSQWQYLLVLIIQSIVYSGLAYFRIKKWIADAVTEM